MQFFALTVFFIFFLFAGFRLFLGGRKVGNCACAFRAFGDFGQHLMIQQASGGQKQNEAIAIVEFDDTRKADALIMRNIGRGLDGVVLNSQHFIDVIDDQAKLETLGIDDDDALVLVNTALDLLLEGVQARRRSPWRRPRCLC